MRLPGELHNWIHSKNHPFEQGVKLYFKYGKSTSLKSLFQTETSYSRKKLIEQIQAICDQFEPPKPQKEENEQKKSPEKISGAKSAVEARRFHVKEDHLGLPSLLKNRAKLKTDLFSEAAELRRRLPALSVKERIPVIKRIKEIFDEIDLIWFELDFYKSTGEQLTEDDRSKNRATILRDLQNARSNVSRYKGSEKNELYLKWEKKRQKLQSMYDELILANRYQFE